MPRPRKDAPGGSAKERLENAFWNLLAEGSFSDMTIKTISRRAGVNHNTFYYHYDNLNDMAQKLFDKNMMQGTPAIIAKALHSEHPTEDMLKLTDEEVARMRKVQLFARSDSPVFSRILRTSIRNVWLEMSGIDESDLSEDERMDVEFAVGGEIALLQQDHSINSDRLLRFAKRPLGRGVFTMVHDIEEQHAEEDGRAEKKGACTESER
jgi:AcrR family transcriptional regulator